MKESFTEKISLNNANTERLYQINSIVDEYKKDGYTLTLRQLYYQLVSRAIIPNVDGEYRKLGNVLKKGRMAGIIDWAAIEDRIRVPRLPYWSKGVSDALQDTIDQYRINRMDGQDFNIEVWVEKDALSSIVYRVTSHFHVRMMINRGYSSLSAMYRASKRLSDGDTILYLGDHDPSGIDMIRDIKDRLMLFKTEVNVVPIALTMEQVRKYNPPPNPAKITDSRSTGYIEKFGDKSWELDALPPKVLSDLVSEAILNLIDVEVFNKRVEIEEKHIEQLKKMMSKDEEE